MAVLGLLGCGAEDTAQQRLEPPRPLTVMTYNVMCSFCDQGYDRWEQRLPYLGDTFTRYDADLYGLQELTPLAGEVEQIQALLPDHDPVFYGPEGEVRYPDALIMFRRSRFELLEEGSYWLSPTPDVAKSTGFAKPQLARLVVWAKLRDRAGGRELYFATTHFDNNQPSQAMSAPLVKERTAPFEERMPVVVVGDFNSKPSTEAFQTLTGDAGGFRFVDSQSIAEQWSVGGNQQPKPDYELADRIDHIFVAGQGVAWKATSWVVDLSTYGPNQLPPSDHYSMTATLEY